MPEWTLRYDDFNPAEEKLREALCTLGNGYFFTRGAAAERVPAIRTIPEPILRADTTGSKRRSPAGSWKTRIS